MWNQNQWSDSNLSRLLEKAPGGGGEGGGHIVAPSRQWPSPHCQCHWFVLKQPDWKAWKSINRSFYMRSCFLLDRPGQLVVVVNNMWMGGGGWDRVVLVESLLAWVDRPSCCFCCCLDSSAIYCFLVLPITSNSLRTRSMFCLLEHNIFCGLRKEKEKNVI